MAVTIEADLPAVTLDQRLTNIFCNGPNSKYFRLRGPTFCRCDTTAAVQCGNKWPWPCPSETAEKTGRRRELACGP